MLFFLLNFLHPVENENILQIKKKTKMIDHFPLSVQTLNILFLFGLAVRRQTTMPLEFSFTTQKDISGQKVMQSLMQFTKKSVS